MKTAPLLSPLVLLAAASLALAQSDSSTIKATTKFRPDGTKSSTVVDPEARTAVETISDARDRVLQKTTYLLDEKNYAFAAVHYDQKGAVRYKESYLRDPQGRVVETKFFSAEGAALGRRVFNYNGNNVAIEDYDAQGTIIPIQKATTSSQAKAGSKKK